MSPGEPANGAAERPGLVEVLRVWGRIGCLGFGGPPAHIAMLREALVSRHRWLSAEQFEDAISACNLLPGPASTQLAIFTAWWTRGTPGALVGGLAFVLPGLVAIVALAAIFLGDPPNWIRGAGAGAGAAVAAVALHAGFSLVKPSMLRAADRFRWGLYLLVGAVVAAVAGPGVVLALLVTGAVEAVIRSRRTVAAGVAALPLAALPLAAATTGGLGALAWVAFKVGALSYGGGFVIIPLMQEDAVEVYNWMTGAEFLNAVALGQVTPGPVVHTVTAVGYAASGIGGAALAALVAFAPSFAFVLGGARHFERLRESTAVGGFLGGAGPAAIGAILGSAVPLALALGEPWQWSVLAAAAAILLGGMRGVVTTLVLAGAVGAGVALLGGPLP